MDLASPLAQSFGVSPEVLWRRGIASLLEFERGNRRRLQRMFNGFKRARRQRGLGSREADRLRLGTLASARVDAEFGLEVKIETENLYQMKRGLADWLALNRTRRRGAADYGALLAPDGGILRESISETSFLELLDLDRKAASEPASITAAELERARELSGIPTLQVAGMAARK